MLYNWVHSHTPFSTKSQQSADMKWSCSSGTIIFLLNRSRVELPIECNLPQSLRRPPTHTVTGSIDWLILHTIFQLEWISVKKYHKCGSCNPTLWGTLLVWFVPKLTYRVILWNNNSVRPLSISVKMHQFNYHKCKSWQSLTLGIYAGLITDPKSNVRWHSGTIIQREDNVVTVYQCHEML